MDQFKPNGAPLDPGVPIAPPRQKQAPPVKISVPSFSVFRAQTPRILLASPVRRKPLPPNASPLLTKTFPAAADQAAVGKTDYDDSPIGATLQHPPTGLDRAPWASQPWTSSPPLVVRDLDRYPHGQTPSTSRRSKHGSIPTVAGGENLRPRTRGSHVRLASEPVTHSPSHGSFTQDSGGVQRSATMSLRPGGPAAPLRLDATSRTVSDQSNESYDSTATSKPPKSPGNTLTTFLGWKASSPLAESSSTTFSDNGHSPMPSPLSPSPQSSSSSHKSGPLVVDISKAIATPKASYFAHSGLPSSRSTSAMATQVGEMEEELREVSSELATSIKREMELEDLVDRLQLEASQGSEHNRRTSDYFSDSGASSVRYPLSEVGGKSEDLEKWKRALEQDKAQFKVDFTQKLQYERGRRKVLEDHIHRLEEESQHLDQGRSESTGAISRVRELEALVEDIRRKLLEERQLKENFEDLLTALRAEIEERQNERDNLRDEVVPQLQARVDGLEAEAAESQKLAYEYSRMQQEIEALKIENNTLTNAKRLQLEIQQQQARFDSIAEESESEAQLIVGLTRSNSLARGTRNDSLSRSASLSRSKSIVAKERESRDPLADRVKDIEMQRDALHKALKSLLERQNYQNRATQKRMRALEAERDKAIQSGSPRRQGYEREVSCLREEINHLRRRADDAIEQKWQCEKGLGGLKMDLDRAEQETSSLRKLLHEREMVVPEAPGKTQDSNLGDDQPGSESLEKAYKELQSTHALSLARIRELRGSAPMIADDAETANTLELLKKSISEAEAERYQAEQQAGQYRAHAESLQEAESFHASENNSLAGQLRASADRVEALAEQTRQQLGANSALRQRLAEAVTRGENEQRTSATRIIEMQGRLKSLEDKVMAAQQHSEDAVAQHEDEIRELRDSHNTQLQRVKTGLRTPVTFSPQSTSPLSPLFGARSPKLAVTSSGIAMSLNKALRTEFLEKRVEELEKALRDADREMEEVVSRMNMAQIEVMELQSARDEAMRQTRKLQAQISTERETVKVLMS